jgi:asparagine synthase (glutamine-hydrolysing)
MSGFFGILRQAVSRVDARCLERVAEDLKLRGSDGLSSWVQGGLSGCFSFLQTGQVNQAARQPVALEQRFLLVGDVRLDGRQELLAQLAEGKEAPAGDATSEDLLLCAWQRWGEACLQRIIGDFSFALWDIQEKCLWCARDFVGPRPFFYSFKSDAFCFTNTLQTLRRVPEVSSELDDIFIGDFLLDGWSADPERTAYKDIRRLPPGHLLKFSHDNVEVRRFLKLPIEEPLHLSKSNEYIDAYSELLHQAVRDRLPEGAVSLYLSGGLDSASVCSVACRIAALGRRKQLKAFTFSWRPLFDDEEPEYASATAKHLGLAHEILEDSSIVPGEASGLGPDTTPEPSDELFFGRARRHFARIAAHARVVLAGDGGDDVLTGQAWPYFNYLRTRRQWARIGSTFGGFFWSHGRFPPLRGGFRVRLRRLLNSGESQGTYPDWLTQDFSDRANLKQRWQELRQRPKSEHPVHPEAYGGLHSAYWAGVLEGEDAGWTRVPLETRAPLLDLRVLRFLLRVPPVPWCADKQLARRAMENCLPGTVLRRPKTPLLRDPLKVCLATGQWKPECPQVPQDIHHFVNWKKYVETFEHVKGSSNSEILRPLCLVHWLKDIENAEGIK